jgi:hypothetical protein
MNGVHVCTCEICTAGTPHEMCYFELAYMRANDERIQWIARREEARTKIAELEAVIKELTNKNEDLSKFVLTVDGIFNKKKEGTA